MGRSLDVWIKKVRNLVRDSGTDLDPDTVVSVGIEPALAQLSIDRPRSFVVEHAGTGSHYVALPTAWIEGFSRIEFVECPARQNPPQVLDDQDWSVVRDPVDVTVTKLLLRRAPLVSEHVRIGFTAMWPLPTAQADDELDDLTYHAVTALAASFCCTQLAAEAARSRQGALATNFVDGAERARQLKDLATQMRSVYDAYLGLNSTGAGSTSGPASGRIDFDPSADWSLFHGGRR
jgi:hypothetical protein